METCIYSKKACELLAQELVTEQAEVVKHQAIVEGIRKTIFGKKKEIIKPIVENYFFHFDGRKFSALDLSFSECDNLMFVSITFGEDPEAVDLELLTKREAELMKQYSESYDRAIDDMKGAGEEAIRAARNLLVLKNNVNLLKYVHCTIHTDDANKPEFFVETGIKIRCRDYSRPLENCINR